MQTLWVYIDDIAGKGVGFFLMVELLAYMSVSMIPLALPIAVLISSVMVLGNMAERYELSSFKSAGVSLWRVMFPLVFTTFGIATLSFFCSNNLIPVSNLKFKSRLHDIRRQKPTLSLEEGLFNDDFEGYSIRIGKKMPDGQNIKDILLYDHSEAAQGRLVSVTADRGEMFATEDDRYFIMHLYDGNQYSEPKPTKKEGKENAPFVRTKFKEWYKVFDLDEFEIDRTDEDLFKSHHSMLTIGQLNTALDSIDARMAERIRKMGLSTEKYFYFIDKARKDKVREDARRRKAEQNKKKGRGDVLNPLDRASTKTDSSKNKISVDPSEKYKNLQKEAAKNGKSSSSNSKKPTVTSPKKVVPKKAKQKSPTNTPKIKNKPPLQAQQKKNRTTPKKKPAPKKKDNKKKNDQKSDKKSDKKKRMASKKEPFKQEINKPLSEYKTIAELFPSEKQSELYDKSKTFARSILSQAEAAIRSNDRMGESRVMHVFELNSKFSMAVACIIFLFIGAPMGAIVKKGGFGWPLLISIIFFMIYIILTIFCKNIAERFVIDATLAAWTPCLVIFPIGLTLSFMAMRDMGVQSLLKVTRVVQLVSRLFKWFV